MCWYIFSLFQTQNLDDAIAIEYWLCCIFVVGNIINSKRRVRLPEFKDFCHKAYMHFKKYFGWCYIPNQGKCYSLQTQILCDPSQNVKKYHFGEFQPWISTKIKQILHFHEIFLSNCRGPNFTVWKLQKFTHTHFWWKKSWEWGVLSKILRKSWFDKKFLVRVKF